MHLTAEDLVDGLSATTTHTILPPSITVSPDNGRSGDEVTVTGVGFAKSPSTIEISYDGNVVDTTSSAIDPITSLFTGEFTATFTVPITGPESLPGSHTVLA